jgi:hypothetical protein
MLQIYIQSIAATASEPSPSHALRMAPNCVPSADGLLCLELHTLDLGILVRPAVSRELADSMVEWNRRCFEHLIRLSTSNMPSLRVQVWDVQSGTTCIQTTFTHLSNKIYVAQAEGKHHTGECMDMVNGQLRAC